MTPLRPARPSDLPALLTLWVAAWEATMPAIDFRARQHWLAAHLTSGVTVLCAVDAADTPEGFVTIDAASGTLEQLAVDPRAFGTGVATALLAEAKRRAPALRLTVNQDNPRAVRFYLREGFRITGAGHNPNSGLPTRDMAWP